MLTLYVIANIMFSTIQFPSAYTYAQKGYGDWNSTCEFHNGTDFPISEGEYALAPHPGVANYIVNYGAADLSYTDCSVMLHTDPAKVDGWTLDHLDYSNLEKRLELTQNPPFFYTDTVATCCSHPMGRHVHIGWLQDHDFNPPYTHNGYLNPLDSLPTTLDYDEPMFGYLEQAGSMIESGAWVMLESTQTYYNPFFVVYGVVDAVVNPYSAMASEPDNDKCGARSVSYSIAYQDPYYTGSVPCEMYKVIGGYGQRTLFDMTHYLPDDGDGTINMPEFLAVYWMANQGSNFQHDVVITNSGTIDSIGTECLENVWTNSYDRASDWVAGEHHRGGWDTRLGINGGNQIANHHDAAAMFDGRYAIKTTATSQGTRNTLTRYLPAVDVMAQETIENIQGLVVDNYKPYVEAVIVYQFPDFRILYDSDWDMNVFNCPESGMTQNISSYYYLPIGQNNIGVAVKYSEVVTPTRNDVRLQSESGGSTVWISPCGFLPASLRPELGINPNYEEDMGVFWQCYESRGFAFPGYKGRVQILINTQNGALDLAGNTLDADPSTVVPARDEYLGVWDLLNFDQAPYDSSHTWGTAHSFRRASESIVSGCVYDFRVDVALDTALYAADLIGNCSYSCGFWMERFYNESENNPDTAYVVNADGATENYSWYEIPINPNSIVCSSVPTSNDDPIHSAIGHYDAGYRHLWLSLNEMDYNYNPGDVQIGSSSGTIICVDAIDGIVVCAEIVGSSWYPAPMGVFNGDHILDVDCIGDNIAMVYFWDATGIESGYVDSVLVEVDDNTRSIIVTEAGSSTTEQDNIYPDQESIGSVSLLNNPVNDVISICTKSIHGEQLTLEVYDLSGRVIYHHNQQVEENVANIDISDYPSGVYIVRASIGESTSSVKVIIAK